MVTIRENGYRVLYSTVKGQAMKIHCACGVRFAVAIGYSYAIGGWEPLCVPHMQEFSGPTAPLREWCEPTPVVYDHEQDGGID